MFTKTLVHRYRAAFQNANFFAGIFQGFVHRLKTTNLKTGFLWSCFSKILLMGFRIATNLKTESSKKYSRNIFRIDSKSFYERAGSKTGCCLYLDKGLTCSTVNRFCFLLKVTFYFSHSVSSVFQSDFVTYLSYYQK